MITRENYRQKIYGLSTQNEPNNDLVLSSNVREYVDMYYAYNKFSKLFNIPLNRFFLANGCENAIKNVLLALRPKTLCWAKPTWRMLEVYCEALDIKPINYEYKFIKSDLIGDTGYLLFKHPRKIYKQECDILYDNYGTTTAFTYDYNASDIESAKAKYKLVDVTYKNTSEIRTIINEFRDKKDVIIVGSFDKMFGCNLRLGFAIYPEHLHHKMSLQREQYINALAYNFLINYDGHNNTIKYKKELTELTHYDNCVLTDNFITFYGQVDTTLPHYNFQLEDYKSEGFYHTFTRFGLPKNDDELNQLLLVIRDYNE